MYRDLTGSPPQMVPPPILPHGWWFLEYESRGKFEISPFPRHGVVGWAVREHPPPPRDGYLLVAILGLNCYSPCCLGLVLATKVYRGFVVFVVC